MSLISKTKNEIIEIERFIEGSLSELHSEQAVKAFRSLLNRA